MRYLAVSVAFVVSFLIVVLGNASQQQQIMQPDSMVVLGCDTGISGVWSRYQVTISCGPLPGATTPIVTPTFTLTVTLTPMITFTPTHTITPVITLTPTPISGNTWHAATTNEHGDAPPQWVQSSGLAPTFEGTEAHAGFKGFLFSPVNGVDAYMIIHLISTPSGRMTRYHTYKAWLRDPTGAVSYYYGTVDTGDPLTTRRPLVQGDPGTRPIVLVVDQATYDQMGPVCEVWYTFPTTGGPHISWLICAPVYLHDPTDTIDPITWTKTPLGNWLGLQREADLVWYDGYQPEGFFAGGYTAPTLKNYATDSGGLKMLFFRNARSYACPNCVVPN